MKRILVVEDEPGIAMALEDDLKSEGYDVVLLADGETASARALADPFDAILLDVMLPRKDGFEICREIRRAGIRTPIIMLTARTQEAEKVLGLVGLVSLVVDGGSWFRTQRQVQTAADAAALAGAQDLPIDQTGARTTAINYAQQNFSGIAAPTITFPSAAETSLSASSQRPVAPRKSAPSACRSAARGKRARRSR